MPLTHLLYRCPECEHDALDGDGDQAWCTRCGARFSRNGAGGLLRVVRPDRAQEEVFAHTLAGRLVPHDAGDGSRIAQVEVRRGREKEEPISYRGEVIGFVEELGEPEEGILEVSSRALMLRDPGKEDSPPRSQWDLLDIRAVQTTSRALQISPATGGVVQFRFHEDSPLRWESLLHDRIRAAVRRDGRGEVLEFQPRIISEGDLDTVRRPDAVEALPPLPAGEVQWDFREPPGTSLTWYGLLRLLARLLIRVGSRTRVDGLEHIPRKGPFIVVSNHQSVLDPILVQSLCPRPVHTLTKSTQFGSGFFRWLMPRLNAIPTRRYRIEPQAVRVMLRRLADGRGVGIYPEGERSWDGVIQPFRRGTIRFLLRVGVPIIPCGISGAYDAWPRWSRGIRRATIRVRFGPPLDWESLASSRANGESTLNQASEALREALVELGAWAPEGDPTQRSSRATANPRS